MSLIFETGEARCSVVLLALSGDVAVHSAGDQSSRCNVGLALLPCFWQSREVSLFFLSSLSPSFHFTVVVGEVIGCESQVEF